MPPTALLLVAALCAPDSHPLVAEVLYDAAGDDTGLEFVELFNPGDRAVSLAGLLIEAGDGSAPARWTTRWTAHAQDSIAARARFVIGGARMIPPPDVVAELSLQNGPDAIRLVWPDGENEVVGWGPHEFAEYSCGAPAPDVASGLALARVPDDARLGENALDFRAMPPSPGRANQPAVDLAWRAAGLALHPERPASGEVAELHGVLENRGTSTVAAGSARVRVGLDPSSAPLADTTLARTLAPGDSAEVAALLPALAPGRLVLHARIELPGDEVAANDADSLRVRVGPGPLEITEIQFHPSHDEGEWVEVVNHSGAVLDPAAFTLSDRGAVRGRVQAAAPALAPDSLAVLAQDRARLLALHTGIDAERVWAVSPWPSLNNSDDAAGIADRVVLRETDGVTSDAHDYSASGVPSGVPLERRFDGGWWPSPVAVGTPLAPPRPRPPLAGHFELSPRRATAATRTVVLSWELPWPRGRVALEAYDLAGQRVGTVQPERVVPARGELAWSVAGLPPGLLLVVLRARPEHGGEPLIEKRVLRIAGAEP